ncbi:MAG: hypothetical protein CMG80_17575 [Marinobacter sp.]|nr:hypothetical protein [Marinobacter sp.]
MTPEQMLKKTTGYADAIHEVRSKHVAVGLPSEKVGSKIYGDGMTVLQVGAVHEYGAGDVPRRSFLRTPFAIKKKELNEAIAAQFRQVFEGGGGVARALGRIGLIAVNISKGAFVSRGYGTWPDISQETKDAKGSTQVLIDKGILRGSITFAVRDN